MDFRGEPKAPASSRRGVSAQLRSRDPGGGSARAFSELPGSEAEARHIGTLFEGAFDREPELLTGGATTKAAFHEHAPGKRFLHLATHGWFEELQFPEPPARDSRWTPLGAGEAVRSFTPMGLCGLALAGASHGRDSLGRVPGILTAEELAGLNLSACELAVLSACETHVGLCSGGVAIQSLQSALHVAGVRTAITSLWKVDDEATRELMGRFYTYLWVHDLPVAEALWRAKADAQAAGRPKRDWAAWVLSGDPD